MTTEQEPLLVVTATVTLVDDGQGGAAIDIRVDCAGIRSLHDAVLARADLIRAPAARLRNAVLTAIGATQDGPSIDLLAAKRRRAAGRA